MLGPWGLEFHVFDEVHHIPKSMCKDVIKSF